ncbi:hypothetical protein CTEN210_09149 [Chaetoceros tenuissimus]|uniref:Uncharacterized protein n=1 Tax=Chaetoceros tenuissimus TaxID=426638 RepID=A0AAD3CV27_9STRA|nr:hypothetical protein CTEN210_09149 [Chaetoceros tenuissimus]
MSCVKRIKVAHEEGKADSSASHHDMKHIQDLPNDVFCHCLEFVGKGNFAFVAPVSKHFYWNYINLGVEIKNNVIDVDVILQQGKNKKTRAKDVATGSLRLATECFLEAPKSFQVEVCSQATVNGRLDILKCAVAFGIDMKTAFPYDETGLSNEDDMKLAETALKGHLHVIEFLHNQDIIFDFSVFTRMAETCKARSLHWLLTKGIFKEFEDDIISFLIKDGEFDILKESYTDFHDFDQRSFLNCAAGGKIEVMNWLLEQHDCEWNFHLFLKAAQSGSIPMMELCVRNGCPADESLFESAYENALQNESKEVAFTALKWLREQNIRWDERVCDNATKNGNLKALKWARENGCQWDTTTFNSAVKYGHIDILDYCFENNCPIDHDNIYHLPFEDDYFDPTFNELQERSLKIFKWLHQHSIPWGDEDSLVAAREGHIKTLMWAVENGCPWHEDILRYAIREYEIPLVEYCIQHHSPMDDGVYVFAMETMNLRTSDIITDSEMIEMLQMIHDHGIPWNRDIIACAEKLGRSKVADWLKCMGCQH